jgi:hypothetical protein
MLPPLGGAVVQLTVACGGAGHLDEVVDYEQGAINSEK